jgi:hypothetical protein
MILGIDSITFDASHAARLARFWCEVLPDYEIAPYDDEEIARLRSMGIDDVEGDPNVLALPKGWPDVRGPRLFFQNVPESKTAKSRVHLDVRLRDRAHLDRLLGLGATKVREWDGHDGWWLADPDGNDFCVYMPAES